MKRLAYAFILGYLFIALVVIGGLIGQIIVAFIASLIDFDHWPYWTWILAAGFVLSLAIAFVDWLYDVWQARWRGE
jgi:hypothetical protein